MLQHKSCPPHSSMYLPRQILNGPQLRSWGFSPPTIRETFKKYAMISLLIFLLSQTVLIPSIGPNLNIPIKKFTHRDVCIPGPMGTNLGSRTPNKFQIEI